MGIVTKTQEVMLLKNNIFFKKTRMASRLVKVFIPENPIEKCHGRLLKLQEKRWRKNDFAQIG